MLILGVLIIDGLKIIDLIFFSLFILLIFHRSPLLIVFSIFLALMVLIRCADHNTMRCKLKLVLRG